MLSGEFHSTYASDMGLFETRRARRVLAVFIVALFAIPFVATSYWLDVANRAAIAVIAATGLNIVTCPASGMVAALAGMVFGVPSLRLKGLYLAMATLAAHFIVEFAASHWDQVTGGVAGISIPSPALFGFAVSSFYIGVAGSLLAYQARIISPENFPLAVAIDYLGMVIIGGLGSVLGSILGAVFLTLLPEFLRLVFEPDGLADLWRRVRNWFRLYPFSY